MHSAALLFAMLLSSATVIALQVGSIEPLLLLGIVAAWRMRDKAVPCGVCLAAVVVAKVFLLPLLAWLVIARRWRAAAVAVTASAVLLGAGWVLGPVGAPAYFHMLGALTTHEARQGWSMVGFMLHHGVAQSTAHDLAMLAAAATIAAAWLVHRRTGSDATLLVGCVAASLFASPVVWAHYFALLWVAPLILRIPRVLAFAAGALTWLLVLPHKVVIVHVSTALTGTQRVFPCQLLVLAVFAGVAFAELAGHTSVSSNDGLPSRRREAQLAALGVGERHRELQPVAVPVGG